MDNSILGISKIFESRIRLQMIASLSFSDLTYNQLREICQCTNGNMTTHTSKLIDNGFIVQKKEFVNKKTQTTYHLTEYGRNEFKEFVKLLASMVKDEDK